MTEAHFFQDIAMLLFVSGGVAMLFSRLGWPKAIGYILAGIVLNEYTWGGSFLVESAGIRTSGQLGVVFLMFSMGLSFSAKDLRKIRSVALPAAIFDTVVMICLGYTVGTKVFGWSAVPSVFLGVAICDSATTLLAKVLDEMGWSRRQFAKCVLGTSVCEDIVCVGAIAVATGFAQGKGMSAGALATSLWWLLVFFLTVLVFGFILIPRLLTSVAKRKDDEALLLTILGTGFFVVYFAYKFNFSLALGAFLVGLIGASSDVRNRLGELMDPLKAVFSAIFFLSIGLMVDPAALWSCLPQILLVSAVVIVGKFLNNLVATLATGCDVKSSVQIAFSMAQIGEFAFMVAILYAGLADDPSNPMFPIAVGASLLTTLLNPWMIRASDPVGDFVVRRTPRKVVQGLANYRAWLEKIRSSSDSPAYLLLRASAIKLGVYAVLMLSVSVICSMLVTYDYSRFSRFFEENDRTIFFFLANFFSLSLLPLVAFSSRALGDEIAELLSGDGGERWRTASRQLIRFVILAAVVALFFLEWILINFSILPTDLRLQGVSAALILGAGLFGWRFFVKAGRRATQRFQEALTAEERREGLVRMMTVSMPEGTVQRLRLTASSPAIGETAVTLDIRAKTGASIVAVHRGTETVRNVGPDLEFRIGDVLVALGDPPQIAALKDLLGVVG